MTPIRETIARAIITGLIEQPGHESEQPYIDSCGDYDNLSAVRVDGDCNMLSAADAVLRALDEAGLQIVRKEPTAAMVEAITDDAWDAIYEMGRTSATIGGGAAHITAPDARRIARAVIAAAKEPA